MDTAVALIFSVTTDTQLLEEIRAGYEKDEWCRKLRENTQSSPEANESQGLLYWKDQLVIPRHGSIHESLFRLAHNTLGHYGADKSYGVLRESFYWPNMCKDLELAYIPSCDPCQRNKSSTRKSAGPLHPLPIPDKHGDSVAIDFVSPLPEDEGYNYLVTMTDRLNSDIRLIPTRSSITALQLADLFFDHWFCNNGLPLNIVSDRDKLFLSQFWKALHARTGVK